MSFPKIGMHYKCKVLGCNNSAKEYYSKGIYKQRSKYCLEHDGRTINNQYGERNPNYRHGLTNKKTYCIDCGGKITGYRQKRCKKCFSKGILNPNYKGGIDSLSHKIRNSDIYKIWRKSVFERDRYICRVCGKSRSGRLHAHHILSFSKFPNKRFDIENGMTVCIDCHREIHPEVKILWRLDMADRPIGMAYEDVRKRVKRISKIQNAQPIAQERLVNSLINQCKLAEGVGAVSELQNELTYSGSQNKQTGIGEGKFFGGGRWRWTAEDGWNKIE